MKKILSVGIVFLCLIFSGKTIWAVEDHYKDPNDEIFNMAKYQLDDLNLDKWDEYLTDRENKGSNLLGGASVKEMIEEILKGNFEFSWKDLFQSIGGTFFSEISSASALMLKIIIISIFMGLFNNFKTSFTNSTISELAWISCYIMVVILIVQSLAIALDCGRDAVDKMSSFMEVLFPILLALLIGMGGITSSSILKPATIILPGITGIFLKNIMLPLILLSAVLVLIGNLNENISLTSLSKLMKNICGWILGIIFTIFIGVLSVQGILAATFDGVSIRTAKYAIEAFVPVVGKLFSQTVDILIGCSLMLKNAVGIVGLFIIAIIALYPVIKIISLMAVYKLCGALLEPISDKRVITCFNEIAGVLTLLFITVLGITIMFFMTIALIIGMGNITTMMR